MNNKKRSVLWKPSIEEMTKIVKDHKSLAEILRYFGLHDGAGNYQTLKNRLREDNIDHSHIKLGLNSNAGKVSSQRKNIHEYLVVMDKRIKLTKIKQRLFKEGLKKELCEKCGQGPDWNGEFLSLQIDHINGDSSDNRLENLRILCPNCHSQTPTFSGKLNKKHYNCERCHAATKGHSNVCKECSLVIQPTKINWPPPSQVKNMVQQHGYEGASRLLGVSGNAIRKHLKNHPIKKRSM